MEKKKATRNKAQNCNVVGGDDVNNRCHGDRVFEITSNETKNREGRGEEMKWREQMERRRRKRRRRRNQVKKRERKYQGFYPVTHKSQYAVIKRSTYCPLT